MPSEQPVLFLWSMSPWAGKVVAYLALRKIPYARCEQPITQPRPDLAALGVNYRRIPVLSIGRDIYCDTLLILQKLEELYPPSAEHPGLGATKGTDIAVEKLFEKWTDVVVFKPAAAVIPTEMDLMKDPAFQKDREQLWGRPWSKEEQEKLRPAGLADLRANFDLLEECLADGRQWILGTDRPMLADIHACWIFNWLFLLPDAYDSKFFNEETYPKTIAWRMRYHSVVEEAKEADPKPAELNGPDAVAQILKSGFNEDASKLKVTPDPEYLPEGAEVEMYPTDTGYDRKDRGKLVALNAHEAVIQTVSKQDGREIRIHYPRWNFEVKKV